MEKGRYKVNYSMEFKDSNLSLKVGDIYEVTDSHNDRQAEISINGQRYTVDENALTQCSKYITY